jgi:hypothetical protein
MALQLSEQLPDAISVKLNGGALLKVRPVTAFELDLAVARSSTLITGLINSADAAQEAAKILGADFGNADFTERAWSAAASRRLNLIELASICVTGWEGIVDADGLPIEKPSKGTLALLLRSASTATLVEAAIFADVNREFLEGNGSAASPTGGAAAAGNTAQAAANSEASAPGA